MNIQISSEEFEVLKDELEQAIRKIEIESRRSDNIDYHRMLRHKADVLEALYMRIVGQPAPFTG